MNQNVIAAAILSVGLLGAAYLQNGRYYFVRLNETTVVIGDRWTGQTQRESFLLERAIEKDFDVDKS